MTNIIENNPIRSPRHGNGHLSLLAGFIMPLVVLLFVVRLATAAAAAAPVLDLNGVLQGGDFTATYTEDEPPRLIVDPAGLTVSDDDSDTLAWAKVTLQQRPDGADEMLSADPGATGITVKYKPGTGVLDLTGESATANYQQVLRTVTYANASQGPDTTDRTVVFEISDGNTRSEPVTSTVTINAVNDAPLLDNTGTMTLVGINENVFNSAGNKVETIVASAGGDRITDPDKNPLEGIAVIEVGNSNGAWQYSLDAGSNWLPFQNVSNQSAVLLDPLARIRFVPNAQYSGSATITFRAWDQTQGSSGGTGVDVTKNGGTSAFSTNTETATIDVVAVNDPPEVDLNGADPGRDFNTGYLGSNVPIPLMDQDATVADPDSQLLMKATLRLTNRPDGDLESLSADATGRQLVITAYDPATGVLELNGPDSVEAFQAVLRTATYLNAAVTPSSGPRIVEITVSDGTSTSALVTTTIQINPNNTAPSLNAPGGLVLSALPEDTPNPAGNTIAAMLASGGGDPITDPDADALEGVALVGADNSRGEWQYSATAPGGTPGWQPVGVISDTAAILLNPAAQIRFVPAANYAGPSGSLTFRAWDQTTGTNGQRNVNASINGGSSAFSTQTAVASLTVTPINDPPLLTYISGNPLVYQEDSPPLPLLSGTLVITDVDSTTLASATATLVNRPNADAESLAVTVGSSGLSAQYDAGTLLITGQAPPDVYRQVLATLTYANAAQDPDEADRQVQVTASDGTAAGAPLLLTVGVVAVNDAPVIDLNGAGPGVDFSTNFYVQWRPARIVDPNMSLIDQDNTSLQQVTVRLVNPLDGAAESLTARVVGNIKQTYSAATGTLLLSGMDSLSNYQQVLRSITYNNVLESPNPALRTVEFQAQDALDVGPVSRTTISIQPTPTANLFMPIVGRRSEEPNDVCAEAPAAAINRDEAYYADDRHDWFYFDLATPARVVVRLRNFASGEGQLIVARGLSCNSLELIGSNGDNQTDKILDIGRRAAGRYYIWIINDGAVDLTDPYTLRIDATP